MKLKYLGLVEGGRKRGGCGACGKASTITGKGHVSPTRFFILKSGSQVTLRVGGVHTFSREDGLELLKYNGERTVFEVVEE